MEILERRVQSHVEKSKIFFRPYQISASGNTSAFGVFHDFG